MYAQAEVVPSMASARTGCAHDFFTVVERYLQLTLLINQLAFTHNRLLSSLGAADARTGRANEFFAWLAGVGKGAAASGRLQLFLLTHRGASFTERRQFLAMLCGCGLMPSMISWPHDAATSPGCDYVQVLAVLKCMQINLTKLADSQQVLADGRDRAKPTLHVFDPLGSTLHTDNQQSYVVTFLSA